MACHSNKNQCDALSPTFDFSHFLHFLIPSKREELHKSTGPDNLQDNKVAANL